MDSWWTSQVGVPFPVEFSLQGQDDVPRNISYDTRIVERHRQQFRWGRQSFASISQLKRELLDTWHEKLYPILGKEALAARCAAAAAATPLDDVALRVAVWEEQDTIRGGPLAPLPVQPLRRYLQVDAFGGVIARHAEREALCWWEPSPCFPLSRGGLRVLPNLLPLNVAAHRNRGDLLLNAIVRDVSGTDTARAEDDAEAAGGPQATVPSRRVFIVVDGVADGRRVVRLRSLRTGPSPEAVAALWEFVAGSVAVVLGRRGDNGAAAPAADAAGAEAAGAEPAAAAALLLDILCTNWAGLEEGMLERSLPYRQLAGAGFPTDLLRTYLGCTWGGGGGAGSGGTAGCTGGAGSGGERDDPARLAQARAALAEALDWQPSGSPPTLEQLLVDADEEEEEVEEDVEALGEAEGAEGRRGESVAGETSATAMDVAAVPAGVVQGAAAQDAAPQAERTAVAAAATTILAETAVPVEGPPQAAAPRVPRGASAAGRVWQPPLRKPAPLSRRNPRPIKHPSRYILWPAEPQPVAKWVLVDAFPKAGSPTASEAPTEGTPSPRGTDGDEGASGGGAGTDGGSASGSGGSRPLRQRRDAAATELRPTGDGGGGGGQEEGDTHSDPGGEGPIPAAGAAGGGVRLGGEGEEPGGGASLRDEEGGFSEDEDEDTDPVSFPPAQPSGGVPATAVHVGSAGGAGGGGGGEGGRGEGKKELLSQQRRRRRRSQQQHLEGMGPLPPPGSLPEQAQQHPGSRAQSVAGADAPDAAASDAVPEAPPLPGLKHLPPEEASALEDAFRQAAASGKRHHHLRSVQIPGVVAPPPAAVGPSIPQVVVGSAVRPGTAAALRSAAAGSTQGGASPRDPPVTAAAPSDSPAPTPAEPQLPGLKHLDPEAASLLDDAFRQATASGKRHYHLRSVQVPGVVGATAAVKPGSRSDTGAGPAAGSAQGIASPRGPPVAVAVPSGAPTPSAAPAEPQLPGLKHLSPEAASLLDDAFRQAAASGKRHYHLRSVPVPGAAPAAVRPHVSPASADAASSAGPRPPTHGSPALAVQGGLGSRKRGPTAAASAHAVPDAATGAVAGAVAAAGGHDPLQHFLAAPQQLPLSPRQFGIRRDYEQFGQQPYNVPDEPSLASRCFGLVGSAGQVLSRRDEETRIGQYQHFVQQTHPQRRPLARGASGAGAAWEREAGAY